MEAPKEIREVPELSDKELLAVLARGIGFKKPVPTIDEVLDSPYYLKNFYPGIYPWWREKLRELFPTNLTTSSNIVCFTGAIGGGKSTISEVIIAYDIIKLCLMSRPNEFFNIMAKTGYAVKILNVLKSKAEKFQQVLIELLYRSDVPFFINERMDPGSVLNMIHLDVAKNVKDLISDDVLCFHLSELNEFKGEQGKFIIDSAVSRWKSRFINGEGIIGHVILDSSAMSELSPIDVFMKSSPHARDAMIIRLTVWGPHEGLNTYFRTGSFMVYAGDSQIMPHIMMDTEDLTVLDSDKIIKVPMELHKEFEADIVLALREKAGISVSSHDVFFRDRARLLAAFDIPKSYDDVIKVDFFDPEDSIYDLLAEDIHRSIPPEKKLVIRIDCGVAHDRFGLAVGYADSYSENNVMGNQEFPKIKINIPILIGVSRYENQETPINKVEKFILQLSLEYEILLVSTDQYQSTELRQNCIQAGIPAKLTSVDRDDQGYVMLKSGIYQGLVHLAYNRVAYQEATDLQRVSHKKIDHPDWSSKDIMDTASGVVFELSKMDIGDILTESTQQKAAFQEDMYEDLLNRRRQRQNAWR